MSDRNLVIRAGARAADRLREEGFHPDLFGTLVGASGGPKWLVLRHIDTVLIDRLVLARSTSLDTLGSSIGSFRHACYAQSDPHVALACFEPAYVEQAYAEEDLDRRGLPRPEAITRESKNVLANLLGDVGAKEICGHPRLRTSIVAARLVRDRGRDRGLAFQLQVARAAAANALSRRRLGRHVERVVFQTEGAGLAWQDLPTARESLTPERLGRAILSSGSIPFVMEGVRNVPGVPGTLFDGGIVDYHFDFEFERDDRLVLYPHFFDKITPGWFDKPWKKRRPTAAALDDVVMIAPSDDFVAALPGGKVPDRDDFLDFPPEQRVDHWYGVIESCRVLAEELAEAIDGGRFAERVEPFPDA